MDDVIFSHHLGAGGPESSTTVYFEEVRQVAVPVGRQTTSMFVRVHQNAALDYLSSCAFSKMSVVL